jgi:hypothetical protein
MRKPQQWKQKHLGNCGSAHCTSKLHVQYALFLKVQKSVAKVLFASCIVLLWEQLRTHPYPGCCLPSLIVIAIVITNQVQPHLGCCGR